MSYCAPLWIAAACFSCWPDRIVLDTATASAVIAIVSLPELNEVDQPASRIS